MTSPDCPPVKPADAQAQSLRRRDFNRFLLGAVPLIATPSETLLVLGDSLSAEYGLERGSGWVALLQSKLALTHPKVQVMNASISGDTTSGGLSRLPHLLTVHKPFAVVIELGANDALQGLDIKGTQSNLSQMVVLAQEAPKCPQTTGSNTIGLLLRSLSKSLENNMPFWCLPCFQPWANT